MAHLNSVAAIKRVGAANLPIRRGVTAVDNLLEIVSSSCAGDGNPFVATDRCVTGANRLHECAEGMVIAIGLHAALPWSLRLQVGSG